MKITKTTEKFDKDGNLIERIVVTEETIETAPAMPFTPAPYWPYPQPVIITQPHHPTYRPFEITCGMAVIPGSTVCGGIQ